MSVVRWVVPVLSLLVFVILAVLPWGMSQTVRLALALAPGIVIFYWSARSVPALSAFSVFCCGLLFDVLSGDALGYWALVLLVALGVSVVLFRYVVSGFAVVAVAFPAVVAGMITVMWGMQVLVFGKPVAFWPMLEAFVLVVLAYPVVSGVLRFFEGGGGVGERDNLRHLG